MLLLVSLIVRITVTVGVLRRWWSALTHLLPLLWRRGALPTRVLMAVGVVPRCWGVPSSVLVVVGICMPVIHFAVISGAGWPWPCCRGRAGSACRRGSTLGEWWRGRACGIACLDYAGDQGSTRRFYTFANNSHKQAEEGRIFVGANQAATKQGAASRDGTYNGSTGTSEGYLIAVCDGVYLTLLWRFIGFQNTVQRVVYRVGV